MLRPSPEPVLEELNPSQLEAVTAPDGPLLVLAGAGSGKTRAIAHRIAYLIGERGVPPWSILALTFTNKAAEEMRNRVAALVGGAAPDLWVLTFHALGLRLLRRFGRDIGVPNDFVVIDEDDRRSLIRRALRELVLPERDHPVARLASAISARKNSAFSSEPYGPWQRPQDRKALEAVAGTYQSLLDRERGLDFDDLLTRSVELLECSAEARSLADRRFQHVLVDEYQDTNRVQYRLLRLLAPHGNLFVVGDEDQSIYRFRGADIRNILDFESDFPEARVIKLEDNYRSAGAILDAAAHLIARNRERKGKRLVARLPSGKRPRWYAASDERDEASYVARQVQRLMKEPDTVRIAVLYRTHAQSRLFEEEFIGRGIPHVLVGGPRFYERREIKDTLAYLRLAVNPHDPTAFLRAVHVPPRGIGAATLTRIQTLASEEGLSSWATASRLVEEGALPARTHKALSSFLEIAMGLAASSSRLSPAEMVKEAIERSGMGLVLERQGTTQAKTRLENLAQLVTAAHEYELREQTPSLAGFLDNISLFTDLDRIKDDAPCLLMTLHGAKGLEFDAVFLCGLEEGLFPHTLSIGSAKSVEEERRLCYVGMTRARTHLTLTYARSRLTALQSQDRTPSRFLEEIPMDLLEPDLEAGTASLPGGAPSPPLRRGLVVRHPLFGEGTVVETDSTGLDQKVTVIFRTAGRKKLLSRYADLEIVGR